MSSGFFTRSYETYERPQIKGYVIEDCIGWGGHSKVYRARGPDERPVAIKRWLDPEAGGERPRMRREARALAAIDHPGVARFITLVKDQVGAPCLVMELIEGETLAALIQRRGRLGPEATAAIGAGLASALECLHAQGIVHRDLKPENVILRDGAPVLIDFSIARYDEDPRSASLTGAGEALGTACTMAPEQFGVAIDGERWQPGPWSDLYGLGAILFQCLTGLPPWDRESAWERVARNPWDHPHPSDHRARSVIEATRRAIPPRLSRIIRRCLQGRPDQRPKSAAELRRILESTTRPGPAPRRVAAALAIAAASIGMFFLALSNRSGEAPPKGGRAAPAPGAESQEEQAMSRTSRALVTSLAIALSPAAVEAQSQSRERKTIQDPKRYAPVRQGLKRVYRLTRIDSRSGAILEERKPYTALIEGRVKRWGKTYTRLRRSDPSGLVMPDELYRVSRRGVERLAGSPMAVLEGAKQTKPGRPERVLAFPIKLDQALAVYKEDRSIELAGDVHLVCGEDKVRAELLPKLEVAGEVLRDILVIRCAPKRRAYYAPGLGLVRFEDLSGARGMRYELIRHNLGSTRSEAPAKEEPAAIEEASRYFPAVRGRVLTYQALVQRGPRRATGMLRLRFDSAEVLLAGTSATLRYPAAVIGGADFAPYFDAARPPFAGAYLRDAEGGLEILSQAQQKRCLATAMPLIPGRIGLRSFGERHRFSPTQSLDFAELPYVLESAAAVRLGRASIPALTFVARGKRGGFVYRLTRVYGRDRGLIRMKIRLKRGAEETLIELEQTGLKDGPKPGDSLRFDDEDD